LLDYRKSQEIFASKVRKIEEEDAKLRLQEQLEKKLRGDVEDDNASMTPQSMLEQMQRSQQK
jgi:hypothetical protein